MGCAEPVGAKAFPSVSTPQTIIRVSALVLQLATPLLQVCVPFTLISGTAGVFVHPLPVNQASFELAVVLIAILQPQSAATLPLSRRAQSAVVALAKGLTGPAHGTLDPLQGRGRVFLQPGPQ